MDEERVESVGYIYVCIEVSSFSPSHLLSFTKRREGLDIWIFLRLMFSIIEQSGAERAKCDGNDY